MYCQNKIVGDSKKKVYIFKLSCMSAQVKAHDHTKFVTIMYCQNKLVRCRFSSYHARVYIYILGQQGLCMTLCMLILYQISLDNRVLCVHTNMFTHSHTHGNPTGNSWHLSY